MIVITRIETLETDKSFHEMQYEIYSTHMPFVPFGKEMVDIEVAREIIHGKRFVHPSRGIDVIVGMSSEAGKLVGLQYEAWEAQEQHIEVLRKSRDLLASRLDDIKAYGLWDRIKCVFTGIKEKESASCAGRAAAEHCGSGQHSV